MEYMANLKTSHYTQSLEKCFPTLRYVLHISYITSYFNSLKLFIVSNSYLPELRSLKNQCVSQGFMRNSIELSPFLNGDTAKK